MNEKQKAFIESLLRIVIGIILAGMAGGKFFGKDLTIIQYVVLAVFTILFVVTGIIMQRK